MTSEAMLEIAVAEARRGAASGGIPIGAALFDAGGRLLGSGHNCRIQSGDPTAHGEVMAVRNAGALSSYAGTVLVTTLAPCWLCSGLMRMFQIPRLIVGETYHHRAAGSVAWLQEAGVEVDILDSAECIDLLARFIAAKPDIWNDDSGHQPYESAQDGCR